MSVSTEAEYDVALARFRELWPIMAAHDAGSTPVGSPESDEFEELANELDAYERANEKWRQADAPGARP